MDNNLTNNFNINQQVTDAVNKNVKNIQDANQPQKILTESNIFTPTTAKQFADKGNLFDQLNNLTNSFQAQRQMQRDERLRREIEERNENRPPEDELIDAFQTMGRGAVGAMKALFGKKEQKNEDKEEKIGNFFDNKKSD